MWTYAVTDLIQSSERFERVLLALRQKGHLSELCELLVFRLGHVAVIEGDGEEGEKGVTHVCETSARRWVHDVNKVVGVRCVSLARTSYCAFSLWHMFVIRSVLHRISNPHVSDMHVHHHTFFILLHSSFVILLVPAHSSSPYLTLPSFSSLLLFPPSLPSFSFLLLFPPFLHALSPSLLLLLHHPSRLVGLASAKTISRCLAISHGTGSVCW